MMNSRWRWDRERDFEFMKRKACVPEISKQAVWMILAVIVACGAFFRIHQLDLAAFRSDVLPFLHLAEQQVPPLQVFVHWRQWLGAVGQMPFPAWIMQQFLEWTEWTITPFTVRLPFALAGVLAIPVAFFAGRKMGGAAMGLLLAALLALNPFHIAASREAGFHATLILGGFLQLWAVWILGMELHRRQSLDVGLVVLAAGLFLAAYSHLSGLILSVSTAALLFDVLFKRCRGWDCFGRSRRRLTWVYVIVLSPLIFVSWGLRPILSEIGGNVRGFRGVSTQALENMTAVSAETFFHFGWGRLLFGWPLPVLAVVLALWAFAKSHDVRWRWILFMAAVQFIVFAISGLAAGGIHDPRHLFGIMPFYLTLVAFGLLQGPCFLPLVSRRPKIVAALQVVCVGMGLGLCVYPAYLYTQLIGWPMPCREVVRWADAHLPPHTPVLVNRSSEAWNEWAAHPSTNVYFTFTVPNEPAEVHIANRWRDTARAFLENYPDAAYLESSRAYWNDPAIGAWEWPERYFARRQIFVNEAGLKLRKMQLAPFGAFYAAHTNALVVELFYNRRPDILQRARDEGRRFVLLYGGGWDYAKPWQQTRDYRDWRVLHQEAVLEAWNLTDEPLPVTLRIQGVAVPGSKRVKTMEEECAFVAGRLSTWAVRNIELESGANRLLLFDAMPETESVLMVSDAELEPEMMQMESHDE